MKFNAGDEIDSDHCNALRHEYMRCEDAFNDFTKYASRLVFAGADSYLSYRAYNSYAYFIHHLYEFLVGCMAREMGDTEITNKKIEGTNRSVKTKWIEGYIKRHTQRILDNYCRVIQDGTAPSWVNALSYYQIQVPDSFAKDFRRYRNKINGHVSYERSSRLNLAQFFHMYHKFLYLLYTDSYHMWGNKTDLIELKEITNFTIALKDEASTIAPHT